MSQLYLLFLNFSDITSTLIEAGVDIHKKDRDGKTAFLYACQHKKLEAIQLLLEKSADPFGTDLERSSSFHYLCQNASLFPGAPFVVIESLP